jgi:5-methylthioribose kinase
VGLINLWRIDKLYDWIRKAIEKPEILSDTKWWTEFYKRFWKVKEGRELFDKIQGYKTYILAAAIAGVNLAYALGKIDVATRDMLLGLLGAGAISTLSAKMNRIEQDTTTLKKDTVTIKKNQ